MKIIFIAITALLSGSIGQAQHIFQGVIKDSISNERISRVSAIVKSTGKGSTSNELDKFTATAI